MTRNFFWIWWLLGTVECRYLCPFVWELCPLPCFPPGSSQLNTQTVFQDFLPPLFSAYTEEMCAGCLLKGIKKFYTSSNWTFMRESVTHIWIFGECKHTPICLEGERAKAFFPLYSQTLNNILLQDRNCLVQMLGFLENINSFLGSILIHHITISQVGVIMF